MRGYELSDFEWGVIAPLLPNKPRGVPRVDDRRVLNGIFWVLRTGAPWRALPQEFGPQTTCYNRFVRWRKAGVWDRILAAVIGAEFLGHSPPRRPRPQHPEDPVQNPPVIDPWNPALLVGQQRRDHTLLKIPQLVPDHHQAAPVGKLESHLPFHGESGGFCEVARHRVGRRRDRDLIKPD